MKNSIKSDDSTIWSFCNFLLFEESDHIFFLFLPGTVMEESIFVVWIPEKLFFFEIFKIGDLVDNWAVEFSLKKIIKKILLFTFFLSFSQLISPRSYTKCGWDWLSFSEKGMALWKVGRTLDLCTHRGWGQYHVLKSNIYV